MPRRKRQEQSSGLAGLEKLGWETAAVDATVRAAEASPGPWHMSRRLHALPQICSLPACSPPRERFPTTSGADIGHTLAFSGVFVLAYLFAGAWPPAHYLLALAALRTHSSYSQLLLTAPTYKQLYCCYCCCYRPALLPLPRLLVRLRKSTTTHSSQPPGYDHPC